MKALWENMRKRFRKVYIALFANILNLVSFLPIEKKYGAVHIEIICRRDNKYDLKIKLFFGKGMNSLEKGDDAGNKHFLLYRQCLYKSHLSHTR